MCNFTDAIPTGTGEIGSGTNVCVGAKIAGINYDAGCGQISQLDAYDFIGSGTYDSPIPGYSGTGNWTLSLQSTDGGNTWNFTINITGTFNYQENYTGMSCSETTGSSCGDPNTTTITYNSPAGPIIQSYQSDSFFQKAKLWFNIPQEGGTCVYFFSTDQYSGECDACSSEAAKK